MPIIRTGYKSPNVADRQFSFRSTSSIVGQAGLPTPTLDVGGAGISTTITGLVGYGAAPGDCCITIAVTSLAGTVTSPDPRWIQAPLSPVAEGVRVYFWYKIISENDRADVTFTSTGLEWAFSAGYVIKQGSQFPNTFSTFTKPVPSTTNTLPSGTIGTGSNRILIGFGRDGDATTGAFTSTLADAGNLTSVTREANGGVTTGAGGGWGLYSAICNSSTSGDVIANTASSYATCGIGVAFAPNQAIPR